MQNSVQNIIAKAVRAKVQVYGVSGKVHNLEGWHIAENTLGAIINPNGGFDVIILFNGCKLIDFDDLGQCTAFAHVLLNEEQVFLGNADMQELFARHGGREQFIKSVQTAIDKVRNMS